MFKKIVVMITLGIMLPTFCMQQLDLSQLSLDQKIGQLFMVPAVADEDMSREIMQRKQTSHGQEYRMDKEYITYLISKKDIGGVIIFGISDARTQTECIQYFQSISPIPLLIGQDLEPGRVGAAHLPHDFKFPSNKDLGEKDNLEFTKTNAKAIGSLCKTLGVHINFAPVADVNNNPDNPVINDRSFGDQPELVTEHAIAFAKGLSKLNIAACGKHFPGHGDTDVDSHLALPTINHPRERLDAIELYPFKQLIAQGIPAMMIGHLCVPALEAEKDLPATFSKAIVTDLLQKELGFSGLIVTDALEMKAISEKYSIGEAAVKALRAGNDILLCPIDAIVAIEAIKQAVEDGIITEQEIDIHVEKILEIKRRYVMKHN